MNNIDCRKLKSKKFFNTFHVFYLITTGAAILTVDLNYSVQII